ARPDDEPERDGQQRRRDDADRDPRARVDGVEVDRVATLGQRLAGERAGELDDRRHGADEMLEVEHAELVEQPPDRDETDQRDELATAARRRRQTPGEPLDEPITHRAGAHRPPPESLPAEPFAAEPSPPEPLPPEPLPAPPAERGAHPTLSPSS